MNASSQTQISAATALVQLLSEHPELELATWRVDRDGLLSGTVAYDVEQDMRPQMQAFADVLGGQLHEQPFTSPSAEAPCMSLNIYATWRDVRVNVWASYLVASALVGGSAVAA